MTQFVIHPSIWQYDTCQAFAQDFHLGPQDLLLTNEFLYTPYFAPLNLPCPLLFQEKYGLGEPSDEMVEAIYRDMPKEVTRVIAVGGGVMGDLAGFAAAVYMRGIDFYNIPTTLLSQVDSSIGGKVAVDMDGVKNVIGVFYQPQKVLIDPDTLNTLDRRQLSAGLAESIKMAATSDRTLFEKIEQSEKLEDILDEVIEGSLRIKRDVVQQDPTEKGLRRVLNFGHTVGHAIESAMDGQWLHGECVAAGMLPMCSPKARQRIARVLEKYELPTHTDRTADELLSYIQHDKKAADGGVKAVCVDEIGSFVFRQMNLAEIAERVRQWQ